MAFAKRCVSSIAHQIITEKHGGRITCDSTVGEGTILKITLPIA
ncbi:hypothetical protein ACP6PL_02840 [Dapis sp. BLCC M126]